MSYNANIPLITDPILQSAKQIKSNFQAINSAFSNNHVGLTQDSEFAGMHNVMTMRPQGADPVTSIDEVALYNKLVSSIPELFFRPNSIQNPIQMTFSSIKADSTNTQYSFIAGPFIVYGGFLPATPNNFVVNLTPGTTLIYVDLTAASKFSDKDVPIMPAPQNVVGNSFTVTFSSLAGTEKLDVYYFAIGLP